ncbi:ankyrin [Thelephora ganbajun]|uniref:Ankyrin n=1 Tax=Thelephora ganbajun TaxID=370292 RepID=A0ACB6ZX62_THEGA|nr:ankyrin [Thelephora ganbajun]
MASDGASNNERLLAAARDDNEDLLLDVFDQPGTFDINYQDGLGNTALHYAVLHTSYDVLDHILSHEECDVDPTNKLDKATPLHLAVEKEDPEDREYFVENLLEAGANYTIRNKHGETAEDLVKPGDEVILALFRKAQADADANMDDIAYEDDDDVASEGSD